MFDLPQDAKFTALASLSNSQMSILLIRGCLPSSLQVTLHRIGLSLALGFSPRERRAPRYLGSPFALSFPRQVLNSWSWYFWERRTNNLCRLWTLRAANDDKWGLSSLFGLWGYKMTKLLESVWGFGGPGLAWTSIHSVRSLGGRKMQIEPRYLHSTTGLFGALDRFFFNQVCPARSAGTFAWSKWIFVEFKSLSLDLTHTEGKNINESGRK